MYVAGIEQGVYLWPRHYHIDVLNDGSLYRQKSWGGGVNVPSHPCLYVQFIHFFFKIDFI